MKTEFKILLVEDSPSFRGTLVQLLGVYNDLDEAESIFQARERLSQKRYDVVILDKTLTDGDGTCLITEIKQSAPYTVVIVLTSDADFGSVKKCIALGADDYVVKSANVVPDLLVRIPVTVSKVAALKSLHSLEKSVRDAFKYELIGKSPATVRLRETVLSLKGSKAHVLITGESGTGKELIARRLNAVEGGKRPFFAVNCGAIPEGLIESELFGHRKGAFTGAIQDRAGLFELSNNGDIFLDEIGDISLSAQVKILRAVQEGEIVRVGDTTPIKVNCRIIAATHKNLDDMILEGTFREDLFYRLNVLRIETVPLRRRVEDIRDLAPYFLLQIGGPNLKMDDRAIEELEQYSWPGNIRELRNAVERSVIVARQRKSSLIGVGDILLDKSRSAKRPSTKVEKPLPASKRDLTPEKYQEFMEHCERAFLQSGLNIVHGHAEDLAHLIGIGRSTVFRRLKTLGCKIENYNSSTYREDA